MSKLYQSNLARTAPQIDKETLQALGSRYRASRLMRFVIRPISLAFLVLAIMLGLLGLVREITVDARWSSFAILLFLVSLEAIYTTNWLRHPDRLNLSSAAYRTAELLLILIIVWLASWRLFEEGLPSTSQLQQYLVNPLLLFFNARFLVAFVLTVTAWWLSISLSRIFSDLEISEYELRYYSLPLAQRKTLSDDQPIQTERSQLVTGFKIFWFWGGISLIITVGLSTLDLRSLNSIKNPLAMGGVSLEPAQLATLLLYFGLGFWLLSQAKLMEMNARWLINGIDKDRQMESQWQKISLLILLVVGLVASFLPTGPTLAISTLLNTAIYFLIFIVNLIFYLVALFMAFIFSLFSGQSQEIFQPMPPTITVPPTSTPPASSELGETIMMVLSSAFWSIFIVVIVLALFFFFRERRSTFQGQSLSAIWQQFKFWLADLWQRFRQRTKTAGVQFPIRLGRKAKEGSTPQDKRRWRFVRLGGLPPREQIRYFYLSTVRRAAERGVERDLAATPLEFSQNLKESWPEIDDELQDLTNSFLKARYSDNPIDADDITEVKKTWKDVRREIRHRPTTAGDHSGPTTKDTQPSNE